MRIDERREQMLAGGVDDVAAVGGRQRVGCPQLGDLTVADQHVLDAVDTHPRVEQMRGAHKQLGGPRGFGEQPLHGAHPATAIRLGAPTSNS